MTLALFSVLLAAAQTAPPAAAERALDPPPRKLSIPSADEPKLASLSLRQSAEYLDRVAVEWTRKRNCGSCHTNVPYLMARSALREPASPGLGEVRTFFEHRVAHWDDANKEAKPKWDAEVVATAQALAISDAVTTAKLHPLTRRALDRMWTLQTKEGGWDWLKCGWPPYEHDDYYGAIVAALAAGYAPEDYAHGPSARQGLERLREYFRNTAPPDLHHRTMLLWAATRLDGLMDGEQKEAAIRAIRAIQRRDGGWCLPSLGGWKRRDGSPNDPNSPSDGYATGMLVFVLREAGVPASDPAIVRGVGWLKANERVSGRWFTRSLNDDKDHFIADAGTAFAVMALWSCEVAVAAAEERSAGSATRGVGTRIVRVALAASQDAQPRARSLVGWGEIIDPDGDCKLSARKDQLTITVPGKLHDLTSIQPAKLNAPRVLRDVEGDFVAEVRVEGKLVPGGECTRPGGFPYNGAGLLLWKDSGDYIRLERAAILREGKIQPYVNFEHWKDGQPEGGGADILDEAVSVRLSRKGSEVIASVSVDGKDWHEQSRVTVEYPAKLKLGVAAVNSASEPFTAELEGFRVYIRSDSR
jgi:squalene-hopene/tetraprenyl-beta-curcumene cyclase